MKKILGIEFGSTRVKAVLIDENANVLAQGSYNWQNVLVDGFWSYSLSDIEKGLQSSYQDLLKNYGEKIDRLDSIGVSAMMHGLMAFDDRENLIVPFRTWRNTNTQEASACLSELFNFNIPMRWSVSHYFQCVLNKDEFVKKIAYLTTLAGYVHYRLTGKRVLGIDDASGMFPIEKDNYDQKLIKKFNGKLKDYGIDVDFSDLLPRVLLAGGNAGTLTVEGAKWLDISGALAEGTLFCPPEGDMATGMVATNTVLPETANISSGTSANLSVVLKEPLKRYYKEIDVISSPNGYPVALIHTNNCTGEIDAWVCLFKEVLSLYGVEPNVGDLYEKLFEISKNSDDNVGGIVSYNFLSGEPLANTFNGAPTVCRNSDGRLNLANFMQSQIYSAIAAIQLGLDILNNENIKIKTVMAHGGYYKSSDVGKIATSALLSAPTVTMDTAGEGGAYGIALLALYVLKNDGELSEFLQKIFNRQKQSTNTVDKKEKAKFDRYINGYKKRLPAVMSLTEKI